MQTKRHSIAKNTGWLSGVNLLIKPLSFAFIIISTRLLGADDYGQFAFAISIVSFIYVFFEGGINIHTVRSISAERENYNENFYLHLFLKIAGGLLTGIIAMLFLLFTHYESTIVYLTLIGIIFIVFNALLIHLRTYFRAFEVMKYEGYSIAFEKIGLVVICGSVLLIQRNVILFTLFYAITYLISFIYTLILLFKVIGRPKFHFQIHRVYRDIIHPASPYAFMNILLIGRSNAGTLLLKIITHKNNWVGYYNAAYRLLNSFLLFPNMITTPLLPVLVRIQKRIKTVQHLLNSTYRLIIGITSLIAFPIFLLHTQITLLFFGPSFRPAAIIMSIISLNMFPVSLVVLMGTLVAASDRQKEVNKLFVFETITTILLYITFISLYGFTGAAIASIIGDTIYLAINIWVVRDYVRGSGLLMLIGKSVLILAGLLIIKNIPMFPSNPILAFILYILFILIGLFALRIIRRKEIRNINKMFHDMLYQA